MKHQKGFTLIELLAVITIIGLLITIMVPNVQKFSANTKEKMLAAKYETLQDAALIYADDIKETLVGQKPCDSTVTVAQLIENDYIKPDTVDELGNNIITNPLYGTSMNNVGFCLYLKNNSVETQIYNNCEDNLSYCCKSDKITVNVNLKKFVTNSIVSNWCTNKYNLTKELNDSCPNCKEWNQFFADYSTNARNCWAKSNISVNSVIGGLNIASWSRIGIVEFKKENQTVKTCYTNLIPENICNLANAYNQC